MNHCNSCDHNMTCSRMCVEAVNSVNCRWTFQSKLVRRYRTKMISVTSYIIHSVGGGEANDSTR